MDNSAAFFHRLAAHDPKWARSMSNQKLRQHVGLPVDVRDMGAELMQWEDVLDVYETFIKSHT